MLDLIQEKKLESLLINSVDVLIFFGRSKNAH